jgi:hypothetical protein
MKAMKVGAPEMIEGPEAFTRFQNAMKHVLAVPHTEIKARIDEHRKQVEANPNRRGPKRKAKPSASPARGR